MTDNKTYDLWKGTYGEGIHLLDEQDEYPVAGYREVLKQVYGHVREASGKRVLDAGFGTGILTKKLYQDGYDVSGMDMSEMIVEVGKEEMPKAKLVCCDYSLGMPLQFMRDDFDVIISTYGFHHMDHYEQMGLVKDMLRHLKPDGKIVIGGLAFESMKALKEFRKANKEKWLYENMYIVYGEIIKDFPQAQWKQISKCAGIVTITKE